MVVGFFMWGSGVGRYCFVDFFCTAPTISNRVYVVNEEKGRTQVEIMQPLVYIKIFYMFLNGFLNCGCWSVPATTSKGGRTNL